MINVALFGNPNVGKTTVFNLLTVSNQYVGKLPVVTIDKKEGFVLFCQIHAESRLICRILQEEKAKRKG